MSNKAVVEAPATSVVPINQFDHMIELAITGNADLDKLQKLMEMKVRYDEIEAEKTYNIALADFQSKQAIIAKDSTGHNTKYASLAGTIAQIQELMTQSGLSRAWSMKQKNDQISITCTITHVGGHSRSATLAAGADMSGAKNAIQGIGSTVSYLERYTLYAALGIASAEMVDDDGKDYGAMGRALVDAEDIKALGVLMARAKADSKKFLQALKVNNLEELPKIRVSEATAMLMKKVKLVEAKNEKA